MCYYFEAKIWYKDCEADPKHVIKTTKYDRCNEAHKKGYVCEDAKPATGKNGEMIQMGTSKRPGKCPRCLS
jgi:hypothetical protein